MNLAIKFSGQLSKDVFTQELKLNINQMHMRFEDSVASGDSTFEQHVNNSSYWLVGIRTAIGREFYFIFPPTMPSNVVEQEKTNLMRNQMEGLFVI